MRISRRQAVETLAALAGGAVLSGLGRPGGSSDPGRCPALGGGRIRWVVPHAAGGGYDTEARLLQPHLGRRLGVSIHVENLPGAGGLAGARTIAGARPDGLTLGLVGVPGLLLAAMLERPGAPDPARDFVALGRVSRSWHVWATGAGSPLHSIEAALEVGARRPLTFALNEVGSTSFLSIVSSAALLGVEPALVAGFSGTRGACLAALGGDVDLVCYNYESVRPFLRSGDLRPLLQITTAPAADRDVGTGAAILGGPDGLAARLQGTRGAEDAGALVRLVASGRVIVAPAGLPPALAECLGRAVYDTLTDPAVRAASRRTLDVADATETAGDVARAAADARRLLPPVRRALARLRG